MAAAVVNIENNAPQAMGGADALRAARDKLACKTDICVNVLVEVRRQIVARRFGPLLSQLLARACELLDEMDEALVGIDPIREHAAFARLAALHSHLEEVQSLVPPKYRSLARGARLG